jgi:hypothetical protein
MRGILSVGAGKKGPQNGILKDYPTGQAALYNIDTVARLMRNRGSYLKVKIC